jgi:hypothetical protein
MTTALRFLKPAKMFTSDHEKFIPESRARCVSGPSASEQGFAAVFLAKGDADQIIIFSDEALMVEDPRNLGVWKGMGQCNVTTYRKEQHIISVTVRAAIA